MRRFITLAVLFLFTIPFGISISGCGHKSSIQYCSGDSGPLVGQVTTINLTPRIFGISLNYGEFGQTSTPTATDCKGNGTSAGAYTYGLFDANGHASLGIADVNPTNGRLCGGRFNRNSGAGIQDYTICTPGNTTGVVYVVASAAGVSSNPIPIFVHPPINNVSIVTPTADCASQPTNDRSSNCCPLAAEAPITAPLYQNDSCLSQNETAQLAVKAFDGNGNNITCDAGHFTFTATPTSVVGIDLNGVATALQPGTATISATISTSGTGVAGFFTTCPPRSITLSAPVPPGSNPNEIVVNQNFTQPVSVTVLDTKDNPINGLALTYQSTEPIAIPVNPNGSVSPVFPGAADVTAICQPPACNPSPINMIGLFGTGTPVASNPLTITTPGVNSTLLYIASTESRYLVPVDFTSVTGTPVGQPIRLPYVPNSMVIANNGSAIYMGSATELMTLGANGGLTREDPTVQGKALSVSPDGLTLVISDPIRQITYLYGTNTSAIVSQHTGVGTSAAWTPDSQTVYITTGTPDADCTAANPSACTVSPGKTLLVHSQYTAWSAITLDAAAPDVTVAVPSVGAYLAGSPTTARSYCPSTTLSSDGLSVVSNEFFPQADNSDFDTPSVTTDVLAATDDGLHVIGATVTGGPAIRDIVFSSPLPPPPAPGAPVGACPVPVPPSYFTPQRSIFPPQTLTGVATATAINQVIPTSDSKVAFVTYNGTGVLPAYTPATGLVTPITLDTASGAAAPTAPVDAAISTDNTTLFVGTTGDNSVHQIDVPSLSDNAANIIAPNLVCTDPKTNADIPACPNGSITAIPNLIVQHPKKSLN
ncbi:MAG: hypothetical protein FWD64_04160 [Acidobacteriaceae bacterium]|nr:hypothetical protein [Acidobacteriaceae bacterium]